MEAALCNKFPTIRAHACAHMHTTVHADIVAQPPFSREASLIGGLSPDLRAYQGLAQVFFSGPPLVLNTGFHRQKTSERASFSVRDSGCTQLWWKSLLIPSAKLGTGQASIIILSVKNALLPPRPQDEKTYPEVASRSMPRTLKDFCQRACSQKIRRAPLEKKYGPHKSAVSVPSVSFSRDSKVYVPSVKFVVGPVLRFLYRPYFLFF